jgi:uncharacterized membrane protein YhiD involved in acid resistance
MGDLSLQCQQVTHWPFLPVLTRLGLAVAIGLFIGLEREHSGKAGVRTFALTSLTSILINIPLMRGMTKETEFRRRVNFALVTVAVAGLLGVGLNALVFNWLPKFGLKT